jgi:hypothetical protein
MTDQSSGRAAKAFFVFMYHPIPDMGFFHLSFIIFKAILWVSSPPATISFRCLSSAFITSSAVLPWNGLSHGPPICLHVIVFIRINSFVGFWSYRRAVVRQSYDGLRQEKVTHRRLPPRVDAGNAAPGRLLSRRRSVRRGSRRRHVFEVLGHSRVSAATQRASSNRPSLVRPTDQFHECHGWYMVQSCELCPANEAIRLAVRRNGLAHAQQERWIVHLDRQRAVANGLDDAPGHDIPDRARAANVANSHGLSGWHGVVRHRVPIGNVHAPSPAWPAQQWPRCQPARGDKPVILVTRLGLAHVAAALLERGVPVLDVVHEAAYFDQSHMTRSLKRFLGQTPARIARGEAHVCAIAHLYKTSLAPLS